MARDRDTRSILVLLPITFSFQTLEVQWQISEATQRHQAATLLSLFSTDRERVAEWVCDGPGRPRRTIDPWALRHDFLHLDRTESKLLDFLNNAGLWYQPPAASFILANAPPPPIGGAHTISEFWDWQDICRHLLKDPSGFWQSSYARIADDDKKTFLREFMLRFVLFKTGGEHQRPTVVWGVLKSILVTIYLDLIRNKKFKECARDDCHAIFQVQSRHKRKYCTPYCAHIESVRRGRRKQKH